MRLPEALAELGLDPDEIQRVTAALDESSTGLRSTTIDEPDAGQFGGSDTGAVFAANASSARSVARDAIVSMAGGLQDYIEYLSNWQRNVEGADGAVSADLLAFSAAVDTVSAPRLSGGE